MIDQFIISPFQEYSGSMSDGVYYGNILSNNASIQATTIEGSPVSESIDPFQRTRIWSKSSGDASAELRKRNILYSDRIKYKTNKTFGGTRVGNAFMQASTQGEQYFDSLLPSPLDIAKTNGITYALLPAGYGNLASSSNFNLPPAEGLTDIPILFGTSVPPSLVNAEACIDTTWLKNPFPFQTKYKALPRITSNTFVLPEKRDVEVDLVTGDYISPVSQSSMVGSVYFLSDQEFQGFANSIYEGEDMDQTTPATTPAVFTEMSYPTGLALQRNFYGSHAHDFPGGIFGTSSEAQQIVVGESGIIIKRQEGSLGWTIVQDATEAYDLRDAAHSRGPNISGFVQFGYWVLVGSAGKILTNSSYNLSTAFSTETPAGLFAGNFYGVAYEASTGDDTSHRFVAVGSDGEIQYSTNYTGGTWARPSGAPYGGATFDFTAVDYNPTWNVFIAVGDSGTIYVSTSGNPTAAWTAVTHYGALSTLTDDLKTVRCHFGTGHTVIAGENGAIAVCDNNPASEGNWVTVTPPTAEHFNGSARTAESLTGGPDILFYLVGKGGVIFAGSWGGTVWTEVIESPNNSQQEFTTITSFNVWPDPARHWPTTGDYIVAGLFLFDTMTRPGIGRVVDIESTGYTYLSSSDFVGFVNTGDTIELGGAGTAANSVYTRSKYDDGLKAFYGFGKGVQISFPENFDPNVITFMPGVSPDFYDSKTIQDDFQIESIRLFGPKPLGYHFGIYNTTPTQTKCMFRRDRYGQPRDLMEQRPVTKFFLQDPTSGKNTTTKGPVVVSFVSGTMSHSRSLAYAEATSTVSFNRKDSGVYDIECRAGQPFFDDQLGLTDLIDVEKEEGQGN